MSVGAAPIIGGIGSLIGGIGSAKAASQGAKAAQQAADAQSQLYGSMTGDISQLMQNYFSGAAPTSNALLSQLMSGGGPGASGVNSTIGALTNFQGLKPQELAALQTSMGRGGLSTARTIASTLGGVANPNRVLQSLYDQNSLDSMNMATQLGSFGAQQELGALTSAGGLASDQRAQTLQSILGILGQQAGLLGTGLGGLSDIASGYGRAGAAAAGNAANAGQNMIGDIYGLAGAAGQLWPGSSGSTYTPFSSPSLSALGGAPYVSAPVTYGG